MGLERFHDIRARMHELAVQLGDELAAPIRDFRGRIVAAVSLSAPKFRFTGRVDEAGKRVRVAAEELSKELGWDSTSATILARS